VEQYKGNQYDDDLTIGLDEIADESFDTGYVDLFEYAGEEESPIARLKTLMLSIEWEITDQVLIDFNDELQQAQQAWTDDPVKLVYIQALQIISKYIFQKKSNAHHNAMKVLIAFFYDLEKIVLDEEISEQEKKEILLNDVKKFERLKQQIGYGPGPAADVEEKIGEPIPEQELPDASLEYGETNPDLYNLKAYILSIDWEITDKELSEISREVKQLQDKWADSKPHKLLLQGIDAVGGYIKLMKSASHGDAFKLLNSFFLSLEKIVDGSLESQQIKSLLLEEADKFNRFKEEISDSITPDAIARYREERRAADLEAEQTPISTPAEEEGDTELSFADTSEFEQTSASEDIGDDGSFSEETLEKVASFFGDLESDEQAFADLSAEEALRGVDVETEADDDADEEALPTFNDGKLAPALAEMDEGDQAPIESATPFPAAEVPGIDVETEADDDADEAPLPLDGDEIAPALFASDENLAGGAGVPDESANSEINKHVDDFFADGGFDFGDEQAFEESPPIPVDQPLSPALSEVEYGDEEEPDDGAIGDMEDRLETFLSEESIAEKAKSISDESFFSLKANVDSLREGINVEKIGELESQLQQLKEALADKPIEKILIHLIGAVVGNIGKKSGEFDDEAVELLHSVFSNLEKIRSAEVDQNQALIVLSNETANILQWQHRMLSS
jgi:pilus assembly protein FimV